MPFLQDGWQAARFPKAGRVEVDASTCLPFCSVVWCFHPAIPAIASTGRCDGCPCSSGSLARNVLLRPTTLDTLGTLPMLRDCVREKSCWNSTTWRLKVTHLLKHTISRVSVRRLER